MNGQPRRFGSCVPATWAHPTLPTLTGGVWARQGVNPMALASALSGMRQFGDFRPLGTHSPRR